MKNFQQFVRNWRAPLLLLLLGSLNILFGALQLDNLYQGPPEEPDEFTSMHYFSIPVPIVLHIVFGIIWNLFSPLQFAPTFRKRNPSLHRWSGRFLIPAGFIVALTGIWMNQYYPRFGGFLKYSGVFAHSTIMLVGLIIALRAILNRNIPLHRTWMMMAVAAGLGPATQRLFILPVFFAYGTVSELLVGMVVWWGLLLNLGVVAWVLWREQFFSIQQRKYSA